MNPLAGVITIRGPGFVELCRLQLPRPREKALVDSQLEDTDNEQEPNDYEVLNNVKMIERKNLERRAKVRKQAS